MGEAGFLVTFAGQAALLLWGLHMVQTGVQRAFGGRLHALLAGALDSPPRAALAGLAVTTALQSSTATALMIAGFAASGAMALVPALAAMIGANLGTALLLQALAFATRDLGWIAPAFILVGVIAFRRGSRTQLRDCGRVAIGLGLMLLALHLLVSTLAPVEASPSFVRLVEALTDKPLANLFIGAVIAWAAHSSIAGVLLVATLAGAGSLGPAAALAMIAGANLGSALNPLAQALGARGGRERLRLPIGNLVNRLAGCGLVLALMPLLAPWLAAQAPSPVALVALGHLGFNLVTAAIAFPLLRPLAALLQRWLPHDAEADAAAPRYLAPAATPAIALSAAAREVLRLADMLERMLDASARAFSAEERDAAKALGELDDVVDRLHRAVLAYLAAFPEETLSEAEAQRLAEIQAFAIAIEHAADVLSRDVVRHAAKRVRFGVALAAEDREDLASLHAALREQLTLAIAVFMLDDVASARRLVEAKERLRTTEREAARRAAQAAPLRLGEPGATPGFVLDAIRDLRRVGAHLAAIAHPLLERRGELLPTRLAVRPEPPPR
jgi:phosphate:Na+ symporter